MNLYTQCECASFVSMIITQLMRFPEYGNVIDLIEDLNLVRITTHS